MNFPSKIFLNNIDHCHRAAILKKISFREKLCFTQFSKRMAACLLMTFLICLHNQLSYIHSVITYERVKMFEKGDSSIDCKNEWLDCKNGWLFF